VLKGPFSRYDYQRQPDSGISSIRSFKVWVATLFTVGTVTIRVSFLSLFSLGGLTNDVEYHC
jgi:hypothetical protein